MSSKRRNMHGVFVGNLPQHSSEVTVGQLFSCFGEIDSIRVMETKKDNVKIAFVNFSSKLDAERSIRERNGYVYCGRILNVSLAIASKNREPDRGHHVSAPQFSTVRDERHLQEEDIILTFVESPVTFYAQFLRHKHEHHRLALSLAEICPKQTAINSKPLSSKVYAARFSEDGQWYRCKVISTEFYDKSYVHYIDYGNRELVSHSWMVNLPPNLSTPPPLAVKCHLRQLVPVDPEVEPSTHSEGIAFLQKHLQEKIVVARLDLQMDGTFEIDRLVLGETNVHSQLLRMGYASRADLSSKRPMALQTKPILEKINGFGRDNWMEENLLQAKVEELKLQLCQERGKVKAMTTEVKRLQEKKWQPQEKIQLESVLEDLERLCILRRQIPLSPDDPDYLEDAISIYLDEKPVNNKSGTERVLEGLREVYNNLLQTKSLNGESFPMSELAAYYRRLKQGRKSKCIPLATATNAARHALSRACENIGQVLTTGKARPCSFSKALEQLRQSLTEELAVRALESSDVAVLSVMAGLLESTLSRKLQNEKREPVLTQEELATESLQDEDSDDDDGIDDLSSLRQKIGQSVAN